MNVLLRKQSKAPVMMHVLDDDDDDTAVLPQTPQSSSPPRQLLLKPVKQFVWSLTPYVSVVQLRLAMD